MINSLTLFSGLAQQVDVLILANTFISGFSVAMLLVEGQGVTSGLVEFAPDVKRAEQFEHVPTDTISTISRIYEQVDKGAILLADRPADDGGAIEAEKYSFVLEVSTMLTDRAKKVFWTEKTIYEFDNTFEVSDLSDAIGETLEGVRRYRWEFRPDFLDSLLSMGLNLPASNTVIGRVTGHRPGASDPTVLK